MEYCLSQTPEGPAVILSGRFTHADRDVFNVVLGDLERLPERADQHLILDMSGLDFIDSAALSMILLLRQKPMGPNGDIVLRGAKGQVRSLLALTRFSQMFTVEE